MEHLVPGGSCVVDQDVDLSELLIRVPDQRMGLIEVDGVGDECTRLTTGCVDHLDGLGGRITVNVIDDDCRSVSGQSQRCRAPNPASRPGHDRNATRKHSTIRHDFSLNRSTTRRYLKSKTATPDGDGRRLDANWRN
jgi:hypothetical protein